VLFHGRALLECELSPTLHRRPGAPALQQSTSRTHSDPPAGIERLYPAAFQGKSEYKYNLKVGRVDAVGEDPDESNHQLPKTGNPSPEMLNELLGNFERKGFNLREMVVLSGAHSVRLASLPWPRCHP
jgi:Peroxidase